jgi:hypothetical protein
MDSSEERPVDGPPKDRWEFLCHEQRQLSYKNRGKMAAIMRHPSDSVRVNSEALSSMVQFVQRDEVNVRLRVLLCVLLSIRKQAFLNMKQLKCALSFFGPYLVKDSDLPDDRYNLNLTKSYCSSAHMFR